METPLIIWKGHGAVIIMKGVITSSAFECMRSCADMTGRHGTLGKTNKRIIFYDLQHYNHCVFLTVAKIIAKKTGVKSCVSGHTS